MPLAAVEEEVDEGLGEDHEADRRRQDDAHRAAQARPEPLHVAGLVARRPSSRELGGDRGHDRDRDDGVRHLHERPAVGVGRDRAVAADAEREGEHDGERDLVGDDDAQRPGAEAPDRAHGLVAQVEPPAQAQPPRAHERGPEAQRLERHARGRAEAEQDQLARVGRDRGERGRGVDGPEPQEHPDAHEVVHDRHPGGRAEAAAHVEERRGEAEEAVEEDLGAEPPKQRRRDVALLGELGGAARHAEVVERGEGVDDPRRERERRDRRDDEHDRRDRHHRGDRAPRPALPVAVEPLDEDGHERRGRDAAEHDVVEHVRDRVREVVGVGERREAEHPREDQHPCDARDPRRERARGHRPRRVERLGRRARRRHACLAARWRREVRIHHRASTKTARIVRAIPTIEVRVARTVMRAVAIFRWPSGE